MIGACVSCIQHFQKILMVGANREWLKVWLKLCINFCIWLYSHLLHREFFTQVSAVLHPEHPILSNFAFSPFSLINILALGKQVQELPFWSLCAVTQKQAFQRACIWASELVHLHYSWALHFHASFQHVGRAGTAEQKSSMAIFQWRHAQDLTALSCLAEASNFIGVRPGLTIRELITYLYHLTGSKT